MARASDNAYSLPLAKLLKQLKKSGLRVSEIVPRVDMKKITNSISYQDSKEEER